jgi:hypothetical protein
MSLPAPSADQPARAAVTAGMRGVHWDEQRMQGRYQLRPHQLVTADGQRCTGYLYTRSGSETGVVCIMHPRELGVTHYLVPDILDAGLACWLQGSRSVGNDLRLEHETALFDVAAGMSHLRAAGFSCTVLLGNSGGAALYGLYTQQALCAPGARIAQTPGGRPTRLDTLDMPLPNALVFLSPHPGPGPLLMAGLDPSVSDEADPFATDPALDPFSSANGYDPATRRARYAPEFITRYRAAQRQRVARIDGIAQRLLQERMRARRAVKDPTLPPPALQEQQRRAAWAPIFQVWRTDADLRSWDTALDPSDRQPGSLWGNDPMVSNYGSVAFARVVTPESWLSSWSALCSNARFEKFGPALDVPTLMVEYTGDQAVFPGDLDAIYASIGSRRKERQRVRGNHHGHALVAGEPSGQAVAGRHIGQWLRDLA